MTAIYTYDPHPRPHVISVDPNHGPIAGGTAVTVHGSDFEPDALVFFNVGISINEATDVVVVDDHTITCITPAAAAGAADVEVDNSDGSFGSGASLFFYLSDPTITDVSSKDYLPGGSGAFDVSPAAGLICDLVQGVTGARDLQIIGTDFFTGAEVLFTFWRGETDGSPAAQYPATNVVVVDATTITCQVPTFPPFSVFPPHFDSDEGPEAFFDLLADVTVKNTDDQEAVAANSYEYMLTTPTITDIFPPTGSMRGKQTCILTGTDFYAGLSFRFGGQHASSVKVVGEAPIVSSSVADPSIIVTLEAHGLVDGDSVSIIGHIGSVPDINGSQTATVIDALHFSIPVHVTTSGTGGTVSPDPHTRVMCLTPSGVDGTVPVKLRNVDRQFDTTEYIYTYDPPLVVTSIGPIRRDGNAISISDEINDSPNTCSLTVGGRDGQPIDPPPQAGQNVQVFLYGALIFGGTIQSAQVVHEEGSDWKYHCSLTDYIWELNRRRPFATFTGVEAGSIIATLILDYATSFNTTHVQAGMPTLTITFDGTQDLASCISAVMEKVEGWWYPDYERSIHAQITPSIVDPPDAVDDDSTSLLRGQDITITTDISQVRTRVWVKWTSESGTESGFQEVNDLPAQAVMAALEGGGGIHEDYIQITAPDTGAAITAGHTWLNKVKHPAVTIEYSTSDLKSRTGKVVHFDLSEPEIVGDFLIQSMSMSEINISDDWPGRCEVRASLIQSPVTKFNFIDLLRRVVLNESGRGAITISGGGGGGSFAVGNGLALTDGQLDLILDGATLSKSTAGMRVTGQPILADGSIPFDIGYVPTPGSNDPATAAYAESVSGGGGGGVAFTPGDGLEFDTTPDPDVLNIKLDGTSLSKSAAGLKVVTAGATGASVYRNATLSISANTQVPVPFTTVQLDPDGSWSGTHATRLTCMSAGRYLIVGQVTGVPTTGTGFYRCQLLKNGSAILADNCNGLGGITLQVSREETLAVTDYIELVVTITDAGATTNTLQLGAGVTFLQFLLLPPGTTSSGGGGSTNTWDETPSGAIDSVNVVYTTTLGYRSNTLRVFLNGVRQHRGIDFAETGASTFTFSQPPLVDDFVLVDYEQA